MKPIKIFRHIEFEGPGYLGDYLDHHAIPYVIVPVDEGAPVDSRPDEASGLVFMGGPMSVNDDLEWINDEIKLIRQAHVLGIPVLGHCLGGQLISRALGASVHRNPVPEIGWHPVQVLDNNTAKDWFNGLDNELMVYHWHGETFSLPDGAIPLLKSRFCEHQAWVCGNTLALQCHIEMQAEMIPVWSDHYRDEITAATESIQTSVQMQRDLDIRIMNLNRIADIIYSRWMKPVLQ